MQGDLEWLRGLTVLVTGSRVSGLAVIKPLLHLGARVVATDSNESALAAAAQSGAVTMLLSDLESPDSSPSFFDTCSLVVTSPGFRADSPVLVRAAESGVPIWGDVEFSWRVDRAELYGPTTKWLVVTGTNGKTTTTTMLASILDAAAIPNAACGNIGLPVLDALQRQPTPEVLAVELSSFQLFWSPSVHPEAGAVLNIAEDHLDWHGSMAAYIAAKARALTGRVAIVGLDDAHAAALGDTSTAGSTVGFRLGEPAPGELGVLDGNVVDRAFVDRDGSTALTLMDASGIDPPGPAGVLDALAAAALARSIGVAPDRIESGLREHRVGPHRASIVAEIGGVVFIDDSKATNPHAARSSILAHPRVVWVAGGLLKGAEVGQLVAEIADRLVAAVLIGRDRSKIAQALARHAPDVPVVMIPAGDDAGVTVEVEGAAEVVEVDADAVMRSAVEHAARLAQAGDVVLLAPAAASLDMFSDYGHRGRSFASSARSLAGPLT